MTRESVSVTDASMNRLQLSLPDRIPSESQGCRDEEQQTDKGNRETMVRESRTGVKFDGSGSPEPISFSHHESDENTGKGTDPLQD
jgi:hypothetical protein